MKIPIDEITVRPGRREAVPGIIMELAESMADVGLLNPITVSADHVLIAGLHRLEAAKSLGWTEIECNVCDLEDSLMELAEIDENCVRTNMTTLERAEVMRQRKSLYETLHPETRAGVAQAAGSKRARGVSRNLRPRVKSFLDDTAEKLGIHRSTVARMVQIAENLTPEAKDILRDTKASNGTLLEISRMKPEEQAEASRLLAEGKIKSVREYQATSPEDKADGYEDDGEDIAEFLMAFEKMTRNVLKEIENLKSARYRSVIEFLNPQELSDMERQTDSIHTALNGLMEQIRQVQS